MPIIKLFILVTGACAWALGASAAGWGGLVKEECASSGKRVYAAKIWTFIGDPDAMTACRTTKKKVSNVNRTPDRCERRLAGSTVYGEWEVYDPLCEFATGGGGTLQRPAVMPPATSRTPKPQPKTSRPLFDPADPMTGLQLTLDEISYVVGDVADDFKAMIDDVAQDTKASVEGMARAAQAPLRDDASKALADAALALASDLAAATPDAAAVRAAILNKDTDAAIVSLEKFESYNTLSDGVAVHPYFKSVSVGIIVDGQHWISLSGEIGLAIGRHSEGGKELKLMPYITGAYGGGLTFGGDVGVNIGLWRDPIDTLAGATQGVILAGAYKVGGAFAAWFGYLPPGQIGFAEFKGYSFTPSTGVGAELEYSRSGMLGIGPF